MDIGELQIENERLKTTLFLLNQKLKMMEDNEDLTEKWKSQIHSKEAQLQILNEQIENMKKESEKNYKKLKDYATNIAELES